MSDLSFTGEFKENTRPGARTALKLAKSGLDLLNELDKSLHQTKRPTVKWDINIYSFDDRIVVEFTAIGQDARARGRAIAVKAQQQGLSETKA